MGTRADFYIGVSDPKWIGSLHHDGHPWNIACKVLIQVNKTMYEETVIDFLEQKPGAIIPSKGTAHKWPWPWANSRMTDYTYFFSLVYGKVYAYTAHDKMMFDPLKIMQGDDLNTARLLISPKFPKMGANIYGQEVTDPI
jgi:hypothetical protein